MIRIGVSQIARVQDGRCAICRREFSDNVQVLAQSGIPKAQQRTREHVWPRSLYPDLKHRGNLVATHRVCNLWRGKTRPTTRLLETLKKVNAELGWELSIDQLKFDGTRKVPPGAVLLLDIPR